MHPSQQNGNPPTLAQKIETAKLLIYLGALSIIVIWRKGMGYRLLNPFHILFISGAMAVFAILAAPRDPAAHFDHLLIAAGVVLLLGTLHRAKAWRDIKRGVGQHSYYLGSSPWGSNSTTSFMGRNRVAERYIDPLFIIILGLAFLDKSPAVAAWFLFSGACLRVCEAFAQKNLDQMKLDVMDSLIVSRHQGQIAQEFEPPPQQQQSQQPSPGVPTGMAPDVVTSLKRRKAK